MFESKLGALSSSRIPACARATISNIRIQKAQKLFVSDYGSVRFSRNLDPAAQRQRNFHAVVSPVQDTPHPPATIASIPGPIRPT